jgi:hypothetical protein
LRTGAAAEGGGRNFAKMCVAAWTSELDWAFEGTGVSETAAAAAERVDGL